MTAVGVGVGIPLGLALFGITGLLWRQKIEARVWADKYNELRREKREDLTIAQDQMHELGHTDWTPDEVDGRSVYEVPDGIR